MSAEESKKKGTAGTADAADVPVKKPAAKKAVAEKKPATTGSKRTTKAAPKKATKAAPKKAAPKTDGAPVKTPSAKEPAAAKQVDAEAPAQPRPATKPATRKGKAQQLRITQVRSQIGFPQPQRLVLRGLGLGRIGRTVVRPDDPCIRGMVAKVTHLVAVEELEA
jgi:large subunit ribosomal protein L30